MLSNNLSNSYCNNVGNDLVLFSSLLAILISKELSINELILLSTLLQSLGENLSIIAVVQENCKEKKSG